MFIESQVINADMAIKFAALGFRQNSYFEWIEVLRVEEGDLLYILSKGKHIKDLDIEKLRPTGKYYAAFTDAEIGDMLPPHTGVVKYRADKFKCFHEPTTFMETDEYRVMAQAKLLLALTEVGHFDPKSI